MSRHCRSGWGTFFYYLFLTIKYVFLAAVYILLFACIFTKPSDSDKPRHPNGW